MKKKKMIAMAGLVMFVFLLIAAIYFGSNKEENEGQFSEESVDASELPGLLSFTYYDKAGWEEQLKDVASGKISYRELEGIIDKLGVRTYVTYEAGNGYKNVPRDVFFAVYDQIVDLLDGKKLVETKDVLFLGKEEKDGKWLTQDGYLAVRAPISYLKQYDTYQVCMIEGEVSGFRQVGSQPVTWENVFVHTAKEEKLEVLFEKETYVFDIPGLTDQITDTVCDLEWKEGQISAIYKKEDLIQGTVLSYDENQIEISGYGTLNHSGSLKIYKTYGTVEQLDESKLVIGNLVADFVVAQKEVCGIILKQPATVENIRVLLLNGDAPYYPEIYVTADEGFTLTMNDGQQQMAANTPVKASDYWKEDTQGFLKLQTETQQGNIYLLDENHSPVSLGYQGTFEIRKYPEGFGVVNELSLEDYLCGVVPSEMPSSYEAEALKVQAVCARSYACIQLEKGEYANFGANVDDSTNYQVYNKQERNEKTSLAVADTIGEVIKYQGNIAEAYYYSTSCGFSQSKDVWSLAEDGTYDYLESIWLSPDQPPDIGSEEAFADFIKNKDLAAYDGDMAYFRWRAELDINGKLEGINGAVAERMSANPAQIQIFDANGGKIQSSLSDLGKLEQLKAEARSKGGVLRSLRLVYEKGSVLVSNEYTIRKVLGAAVTSLTDKNDADLKVSTLLPSACFTAIPVEAGYVLYGGGYGHGIGMSQNGANGMAKAGMLYTDILQKFYQNITIENVYNGTDQM